MQENIAQVAGGDHGEVALDAVKFDAHLAAAVDCASNRNLNAIDGQAITRAAMGDRDALLRFALTQRQRPRGAGVEPPAIARMPGRFGVEPLPGLVLGQIGGLARQLGRLSTARPGTNQRVSQMALVVDDPHSFGLPTVTRIGRDPRFSTELASARRRGARSRWPWGQRDQAGRQPPGGGPEPFSSRSTYRDNPRPRTRPRTSAIVIVRSAPLISMSFPPIF